jgi:DNA-binding NtrC family response regulator
MKQEPCIKIAIVDDYEIVAKTIAAYLRRMECSPVIFTNPLAFLDELKNTSFEIVITDIRMPQMDGLSLLRKIKDRAPGTEVIVISAHADKEDAIEALKYGAYDFFEKPVSEAELVATINRTLSYRKVLKQRDELAQRISIATENEAAKWGIKAFVGKSPAIKETLDKVKLLQNSGKTNVLVLGESGTGKELVARAIHFGSARAEAPFVAVNCSAIPADLAESILFGHLKGSFTGATADRKGQFEQADGGTMFLDEIGDMPAIVQTKLLRVLEDGIVIPVGKADGKRVNVRVVSATNTNLQERTADGRFRSDLYHRLAAYEIVLPPLRQRMDDLPALVEHWLARLSEEMGIAQPKVSKEFIAVLEQYPFPGNVRELKNVLERAMIDARGGDLDVAHLQTRSAPAHAAPAAIPPALQPETQGYPPKLKDAEKAHVQKAMDQANGNIAEAARVLGISRARIYRILK